MNIRKSYHNRLIICKCDTLITLCDYDKMHGKITCPKCFKLLKYNTDKGIWQISKDRWS